MTQAIASRPLVVLAHGFLGGRIQLIPIAAALSRRFDVLNFGYRSRTDNLHGHSQSLIEAVHSRLEKKKQRVHFVTHSFGGVVLHKAFSSGLLDVLGSDVKDARCVLIGPPVRGASFARAFRKENIKGPDMLKSMVNSAACMVLGPKCGMELMTKDEGWFTEEIGRIPDEVEVLVVAGSRGRLNPLIDGASDGVVGVHETMLGRRHFRVQVGLTHNLLLYSPEVLKYIGAFLDGDSVGVVA